MLTIQVEEIIIEQHIEFLFELMVELSVHILIETEQRKFKFLDYEVYQN